MQDGVPLISFLINFLIIIQAVERFR